MQDTDNHAEQRKVNENKYKLLSTELSSLNKSDFGMSIILLQHIL